VIATRNESPRNKVTYEETINRLTRKDFKRPTEAGRKRYLARAPPQADHNSLRRPPPSCAARGAGASVGAVAVQTSRLPRQRSRAPRRFAPRLGGGARSTPAPTAGWTG